MKVSRLRLGLAMFVVLVAGLLSINIATRNTPILGLDLQGGLSVIYQPAEPASGEELVVIRDLMRDQLEDLGIAEPDVRVEGENVIVDLPGISDQDAAFEALDVSGIVSLHPVLGCQAPQPPGSTASDGSIPPGSTLPGGSIPLDTGVPDPSTPSVSAVSSTAITPSTPSAATTPEVSSPSSSSSEVDEESAGIDGVFGRSRPLISATPDATPSTNSAGPTISQPTTPEPTVPKPTTSEPDESTPSDGTVAPTGTTLVTEVTVPGGSIPPALTPDGSTPELPTTPPVDSAGTEVLEYPSTGQVCLVGPSGGSGEVFKSKSADATIDQGTGAWQVVVELLPNGESIWNALAAQCNAGGETCPSKQLAIALDGQIKSAPVVNAASFSETVSITGQFSEDEANDLAGVLNRGAFPVPVERQRVETVSPTAGQDSLNAALIAGLVGLGVVLLFMIAYYRRLSIIIVSGLIVWGMTVFALASFVSQATNYALTLAGATGIIVAVGVTVDSYVVLFERLGDEMRAGRTLANAATRSFAATWRTILTADLVSLIGSVILFALSVGSVKGFALYLGLTTLCDLIVCYFFTRPALFLLGRTKWFNRSTGSKAKGTVT